MMIGRIQNATRVLGKPSDMSYESWRISFQSSEQAARAAYNMFESARKDARACVAHATAAKDAEIEALREQLAAIDYALSEATYTLSQQPAACRCMDCGGDQPGHDPHCANMRDLHGNPTAAVDDAVMRRMEGLARRWDDSANNDKNDSRKAAKRKCAADLRVLAAALSTNPGDSDNGR